MNWSTWAERTFGTPFEIWHDGLDVGRFDRLSDDERALALEVIPEGIDAGDHVAAVGARKLGATELLPRLERALGDARGRFLVEVARAIDDLGGDGSAARARILHVLPRDPQWSLRVDLAIGLRHLDAPEVRDLLVEVVERDPDYLVRYHAAESLLHLRGLPPLALTDHGELFSHVASDDPGDHAEAARILQSMLQTTDEDDDPAQ